MISNFPGFFFYTLKLIYYRSERAKNNQKIGGNRAKQKLVVQLFF